MFQGHGKEARRERAELLRIARDQTAAGDAYRAGDHSRSIVQWCEDSIAEEALIRGEYD